MTKKGRTAEDDMLNHYYQSVCDCGVIHNSKLVSWKKAI